MLFNPTNNKIGIVAGYLLASIFMCAGGCTGHGQLQSIPMVRKDLPPGQPLIQKIPIQEAYYWVDADDKLNIGLKYHATSWLNEMLNVSCAASLVLDGLPAGREKLYQLHRNDLMWILSSGGNHQRLRSLKGVTVVEGPQYGRIKGRIHVTIHQQKFTVLDGWKSSGLLTLVGKFEAVRNKAAGEKIFSQVETEGFDRDESANKSLRIYRKPIQSPRSKPTSQPKP
jgi:hypothetical protein